MASLSAEFVQQPYGEEAPTQSSWEIGMAGEGVVAGELSRLRTLDHRWGFLHSIEVGSRGADIDHLLIGPGGVFTLNTKHHAECKLWVAGNVFMVNGHKQPYIRNSRHEASRASKLLSRAMGHHIPVVGVIVPVNPKSLDIREEPGDVWVIPAAHLASCFSSLRPVLPRHVVEGLFAHARNPATWATAKPSPPKPTPTEPTESPVQPRRALVETEGLEFRRWKRFGHDRLYVVRTSDGVQLGYWNLATDGAHPEQEGLRSELSYAVLQWKQSTGAADSVNH